MSKSKIYVFGNLIVSLTFLVISFFVSDVPEKKSFIYVNNEIISTSWHNYFETAGAAIGFLFFSLTIIFTVLSVIKKIRTRSKIAKEIISIWIIEVICTVIVFVATVNVVGIWDTNDYEPMYYRFSNSNHTIVVEEKSFLLYGGATIYQIMDDNSAIVIGDFTTDDGARNYGKYDIVWSDKYLEITYHTFANNDDIKTKKFDFAS